MNETIAAVYHAAAGTRPWSDALTRITRSLDLKACQMVGVSTKSGAVVCSHVSDGVPSDSELEYIRSYHTLDPRLPLVMGQKDGCWLYDEDIFDDTFADRNPYYRELLIPYGGRYTATAKLFEQDGEAMLVGFMSRLGEPGFTSDRRQFLESVAFHLCQAAVIYHQTRKLTIATFAGTELLRRMSRPAMLLALDRRVGFMNDAAHLHLRQNNTLLFSRDRLTAFDRKFEVKLDFAFKALQEAISRDEGVPKRQIIRLEPSSGSPGTALSLTAFVPSASLYAFGLETQVLLIVHQSAGSSAPDLLLWEAAFNLTPAQSRVALEMFRGHSVNEAAASLTIAPTTVKSHLKEVFWKTGTTRQSQLVLALARVETG
jgi:DNA-binding CsgD family transcriptional regulator